MKQLLSPFTLACVIILLFSTCKEKAIKPNSGPIAVDFYLNKASFAYLANKTIYLQNSKTRTIIDSLRISSNKGQFIIDPSVHDLSFPFLLFFYDSIFNVNTGQRGKLEKVLGFNNPFYKRVSASSFYIESKMNALYFKIGVLDTKKGKITLPDEFADFSSAHKPISPQNDIALKLLTLSHTKNKVDSTIHLKENKKLIKKYPYSFFLLEQLYQLRENFSIEELTTLLSLFDNTVKEKVLYRLIQGYIDNKETYDKTFPFSIRFENSHKVVKEIGIEKAKYHLIVFWAWWCKPCREEIPALKQLYTQKKKQGLQIYHISIDGNQTKWQEALQYEQMPWDQLIVNQQSFNQLMAMYDLKAIPKSYLFDSTYRLIRSFTGFDTQSFQALTNSLK
jgi:thiol-disulfide isomerase/thioredoxin